MLGVMMTRREELKIREDERYRSYYCGLCRSIGKRCGGVCRLALSYEMTFISILLNSLYEPELRMEMHRCPIHPLRKRPMLASELTDYCADMSALISYYDLLDGWQDEKRADRLLESMLLVKAAKQAGKHYPEKLAAVEHYLTALHKVEQENDENLDAAANLTGELMAELCVAKHDIWEPTLREMGFYLGKFIYLCDCYEDLEHDQQKGCYNPLIPRANNPRFSEDCEELLADMMSRATAAFERLPIIEEAEILRNILYSGIWIRFEQATQRRRKAEEKS